MRLVAPAFLIVLVVGLPAAAVAKPTNAQKCAAAKINASVAAPFMDEAASARRH